MYTWKNDIFSSSYSISKRIIDLVHSEEDQELEETMMMSPTIYDNSKSNGATIRRIRVCILGLIFYIVAS
jgi:hypothetical protein